MKKLITRNFNIFLFATTAAIFLGWVAGHQIIGISRDYENYLIFFESIHRINLIDMFLNRFEPGFMLMAKSLVDIEISGPWVYSIIAGLCIFIKIYALNNCRYFFIAVLAFLIFYLLRYFTLFEMTVLRATVASSLAFFVFLNRGDSSFKLKHILLLLAAVTMHYSSIIYLFIYFYVPKNKSQLLFLMLVLFISILFLKTEVINILGQYVALFIEVKDWGASTFLPKPLIIDILFIIFMLFSYDESDDQIKTAIYGAMIGIVLHFALLDMAILAGRFRELMSIFYIIYVVKILGNPNSLNMKLTVLFFVIVSGLANLYAAYIHDPLLS